WRATERGALILSDALVGLECSLFEQIVTSTHTVFMGHVKQIWLGNQDQPLVYSDGQFATLAA
ncbi:MAG: flavin reductase family protein, partial [Kordiimonadaceae bacterium]|nr:flavin reductase family protein [Kordiimonadaceae bacterium]